MIFDSITTTLQESTIRNPHDRLFKVVFGHKEAAQDLIRMGLSKTLLEFLDLETLQPEKDSFINEKMQSFYSDLLYSVRKKSGDQCVISFVLEHKSYVPRFPHIQIGQYLLEGYRRQEVDPNNKVLSEIIPIILYHGKGSWTQQSFVKYFGDQESIFIEYIPSFNYGLIDLSKWKDEQIENLRTGFAAAALLMMKHRFERDYFIQHSRSAFILLDRSTKDLRINRTLLLYITELFKFEEEEMIKMMTKMPESLLDQAKTTYDLLLAKGMERGLEKGIHLEAVKTVFRVLKTFPDIDAIQLAACSGLPEAVTKLLREEVYGIPREEAVAVLRRLFAGKGEIDDAELDEILSLIN